MIALRSGRFFFLAFPLLAVGCSSGATSGPASVSTGETAQAIGAASSVPAPAAIPSPKEWRKVMSKTPVPKSGCFHASHPSTSWEEVPCGPAPRVPHSPARRLQAATVGDGLDFTAALVSGTMSEAVGWFPSVAGVTSETDEGTANSFSLQLNTNADIPAPQCSGSANSSCTGWQQFMYQNICSNGESNMGCVIIEYWLLNYGDTCPSASPPETTGWREYEVDGEPTGHCTTFSQQTTYVPQQSITNLGELSMAVFAESTGDEARLTTETDSYVAATAPSVLDLYNGWTGAEFNVFGDCCGSEAVFNPGTTVVVAIDSDTAGYASCPLGEGTTAETNNLTLVDASCCVTGTPLIEFTESNASGATAQYCPPPPPPPPIKAPKPPVCETCRP